MSSWNNLVIVTRSVARALILAALFSTALIATSAAPSSAGPGAKDCVGSVNSGVFGGGASAQCNVIGGPRVQYPSVESLGTYRILREYPNAPCVDRFGTPSMFVEGQRLEGNVWVTVGYQRINPATGQVGTGVNGPIVFCILNREGANQPGVVAEAKKLIPKPIIDTGYKEDLLYNTDIEFRVTINEDGGDVIRQKIEGFNSDLVLKATSYTWKFSDGTTSTSASPIKRFTTKLEDDKLSVDVTVNWNASIVSTDANALAQTDLGDQTINANLTKSIAQIAAVPIESK